MAPRHILFFRVGSDPPLLLSFSQHNVVSGGGLTSTASFRNIKKIPQYLPYTTTLYKSDKTHIMYRHTILNDKTSDVKYSTVNKSWPLRSYYFEGAMIRGGIDFRIFLYFEYFLIEWGTVRISSENLTSRWLRVVYTLASLC